MYLLILYLQKTEIPTKIKIDNNNKLNVNKPLNS